MAGSTEKRDGGIPAAVSIASDGVTLDGFTVTNPNGLHGVKVEQGFDDASIVNSTVEDLGPTGRLGVTGIIVGQGNNDDPSTITDVTVNNNTIEAIESDVAALGIVVQHETNGVTINNDEIRDLAADPEFGPAAFGFTFAQAVKIDGDGGDINFRANEFLVAIGLNNRNGTDDGSRDPSNDPNIDAKNNWWGSPEGPEEADFNQDADDDGRSDVIGKVTVEPFLPRSPSGGAPGGGQGGA